MNKAIENYISDLLFIEDCIIIPGFGGFVINQESAKLNKKSGELIPPSRKILFNSQLKTNDGLLITYIANEESISNKEALTKVTSYSKEINEKLTESRILRLDKIGLFTLGEENNILFTQDNSINYSLDSFGMSTIYNQAIIREQKIETQIKSTVRHIDAQLQFPQTMLKIAAVIVPLIIISFLSIHQEDKINNVYQKMAALDLFSSKTENIKEIPVTKNVIEANNIIIEPVIPVISTEPNYHIIVGAFKEKSNAEKMHATLKQKTDNAKILEEGELLRVCFNSYKKKEDAVLDLTAIKKEFGSAWILTN